MKKIFLLLPVVFFSLLSVAQCDKTVTFKCYKGREIKNGSAQQEVPFEVNMSIDKGKINITMAMDGNSATMDGEVKEVVSCEWTEYLQQGKTQYKANVNNGDGVTVAAIIEIESNNGQTKITLGTQGDATSQLQLDVENYTIAEDKAVVPQTSAPAKRKKKS